MNPKDYVPLSEELVWQAIVDFEKLNTKCSLDNMTWYRSDKGLELPSFKTYEDPKAKALLTEIQEAARSNE